MNKRSKPNEEIVTWSDKYATGIKLLDNQHKELVSLTNKLYKACIDIKDRDAAFEEAMHGMVDYVRYHFNAELELLQRINYPNLLEHKKQHEMLVKKILGTAKHYESGRDFVPYTFVLALRDWVFEHIAVADRLYAVYARTAYKADDTIWN